MKISIKLAEILRAHNRPVHGAIADICKFAPYLKRQQVSAILNNKVEYVSLAVLGSICDYLVANELGDERLLPGSLFRHDPIHFFELLTPRELVEFVVGERRSRVHTDDTWVVGDDLQLHNDLLKEINGFAFTKNELRRVASYLRGDDIAADHPLVVAAIESARKAFDEFDKNPAQRALVALGSQKSNLIVNSILSDSFSTADAFAPQRDVAEPRDRACPIFFRYRDKDPQVPSCAGGKELADSMQDTEPGIYYEEADGSWTVCPCNQTEDAAVIFYRYDRTLGRVEMMLSGYSGRSTLSISKILTAHANKLRKPVFSTPQKAYGLYVIRFKFPRVEESDESASEFDDFQVIRIEEKVLAKRLSK